MQRKFAILVHHGMSGVAAALIADDHIVVVGDEVHHPALPLVAPVDAYNCAVSHSASLPKKQFHSSWSGVLLTKTHNLSNYTGETDISKGFVFND
ncbi:hypothetical protein SDC9_94792 [bioreactor metagenome]|uniref:Uncharacterized protein n=1 Tax=bioreactor metagenome TaxID=1076179 RepID=A0A645A4E9_9ZZZZ